MNYFITHFNTPEFMLIVCINIFKYDNNANITILDNSTEFPFINAENLPWVKVIDNTHKQIIDFSMYINKYHGKLSKGINDNFGSAIHSLSIQWFIDTKQIPFILRDSDALLTRPIDFLYNEKLCASGSLEIRGNTPRIAPYAMFINAPLIKQNRISFFDGTRLIKLNGNLNSRTYYDTGASFYEDLNKFSCKFKLYKSNFFKHYGAGSYTKNEFTMHKFIIDNKQYLTI